MDRNHLHDSNIRALARTKAKQEHSFFVSLYAQLIIDESILTWKKEKLQLQIDRALLKGDKETFYKLAKEYNQLMR